MAFIEGWPHVRGGLYEGFHCNIIYAMINYSLYKLCEATPIGPVGSLKGSQV